jgi:hypothetical protein
MAYYFLQNVGIFKQNTFTFSFHVHLQVPRQLHAFFAIAYQPSAEEITFSLPLSGGTFCKYIHGSL